MSTTSLMFFKDQAGKRESLEYETKAFNAILIMSRARLEYIYGQWQKMPNASNGLITQRAAKFLDLDKLVSEILRLAIEAKSFSRDGKRLSISPCGGHSILWESDDL